MKNLGTPPGKLWCGGCFNQKEIGYILNGTAITIPCPLCKGLGIPTFKGKIFLVGNKKDDDYKPKIVTTESFEECILLHRHMEDNEWEKSFSREQYPLDHTRYNTLWYWRFDANNKLVGDSGPEAKYSSKVLCPGAVFCTVEEFINLKTKN